MYIQDSPHNNSHIHEAHCQHYTHDSKVCWLSRMQNISRCLRTQQRTPLQISLSLSKLPHRLFLCSESSSFSSWKAKLKRKNDTLTSCLSLSLFLTLTSFFSLILILTFSPTSAFISFSPLEGSLSPSLMINFALWLLIFIVIALYLFELYSYIINRIFIFSWIGMDLQMFLNS